MIEDEQQSQKQEYTSSNQINNNLLNKGILHIETKAKMVLPYQTVCNRKHDQNSIGGFHQTHWLQTFIGFEKCLRVVYVEGRIVEHVNRNAFL